MSEHDPKDETELAAVELVPEDDRVIGRAFRGSIVVIGTAAVVVIGLLLFRPRPEDEVVPETDAIPAQVPEAVAAPEIVFTDVTEAWGISFVHENGATGDKLLPETMGGGVAAFDLEDDGDTDLFFVNGCQWDGTGGGHALYRNDTGRFVDISRAWGLDGAEYGMGATVGDVDGDGDPDIFVTTVGPNRLYRNDGDRFSDVTDEADVAGEPDRWSTGAAFADLDDDGRLDLLVCNYIRWSSEIDRAVDYRLVGIGRAYGPPMNFEGDVVWFYRNLGSGRFEDVTTAAGFDVRNDATGVPVAKALAVRPHDVDGDGDLDVIVANDTVRNFYFENQGDGTFAERGGSAGIGFDSNGKATGAMGIDMAHYRNDDALAVAMGNFANEMTSFYVRRTPSSQFVDEAITEGIGPVSRTQLTFGLFFFDADLDGREDLLQANGHLEEEIQVVQASQHYRQPAQLFWNTGTHRGRRFVAVPPAQTGDLAKPIVGRGATRADLDGDGDLDVVLTQVGGPPLVLRNDQATGHHWLRVRVLRPGSSGDAIGADVRLTAGGVTQRRTVMPTRSYLSQVESTVTFGLGDASAVDSLVVTWPDGAMRRQVPSSVDRTLVVTR